MSLASVVDGYARRSLLARYIPYLRKRTPHFYALARGIWDKVLPMRSAYGLARYQTRAVESFVRFLGQDLHSSCIVEIGSDAALKVVRELAHRGAGTVIGVNQRVEDGGAAMRHLPAGCALLNADARDLGLEASSFDAIFSVSVFEHLNDFEKCLSEMYRVLRPGGRVYADFGPIWSCSIGHHVYAVTDGEEVRHWKPETNPVPNYGHLLLTKGEMRLRLRKKVSQKLLDEILDWVYQKPDINRLFFEDYVRMFDASSFEVLHLTVDEEHVDSKTLKTLRACYPGYYRFGVRNVEVLLRKQ